MWCYVSATGLIISFFIKELDQQYVLYYPIITQVPGIFRQENLIQHKECNKKLKKN